MQAPSASSMDSFSGSFRRLSVYLAIRAEPLIINNNLDVLDMSDDSGFLVVDNLFCWFFYCIV